jgi:DNA modification methylase
MASPRRKSPAKPGIAALNAHVRHNVRLDRIVYRSIDALQSYHRKLHKRSDAGKVALQSSVATFGLVLPILIDSKGTIVGGEALVEAARSLGYAEVPTLQIDHLDDGEIRLLRIALNKLSEQAEWEEVELGLELGELLDLDLELSCEVTGFTAPEIDNLVVGAIEATVDPDDEVAPLGEGPAVSRIGDIWVLGDHRLLNGSSLDAAALGRLMGDERAQMVFTDSPYNVPVRGHVSGLGKHVHREFAQASGEMSEDEFVAFQSQSSSALAQFCEDGALLYLCMDHRHMWEMMSGIRAAALSLVNLAVWVKPLGGMGSLYRSQHELVFVARKGDAQSQNNVQLGRYGRNRTNCWFYPGMSSFGRDRDDLLSAHPTPKPCAMVSDAIRDVTRRGEIVLDGFLGSGTTLIAAERTARACRGVELDPLYVDGAIRRWETLAGRQATLQGSDETFAQVSERRRAESDGRPVIRAA